jgi:hypothetical protein
MKMMPNSSDWLALPSTSFSGTFVAMCPKSVVSFHPSSIVDLAARIEIRGSTCSGQEDMHGAEGRRYCGFTRAVAVDAANRLLP